MFLRELRSNSWLISDSSVPALVVALQASQCSIVATVQKRLNIALERKKVSQGSVNRI